VYIHKYYYNIYIHVHTHIHTYTHTYMRTCAYANHVTDSTNNLLECVGVCCSALQCVAVCCSVLQCAAVCCSVFGCVAVCICQPCASFCQECDSFIWMTWRKKSIVVSCVSSTTQCVAVFCTVLRCLQYVLSMCGYNSILAYSTKMKYTATHCNTDQYLC